MLVNGTKEKNPAVKSSSESALVAVTAMRDGQDGQKQCLQVRKTGFSWFSRWEAIGDAFVLESLNLLNLRRLL